MEVRNVWSEEKGWVIRRDDIIWRCKKGKLMYIGFIHFNNKEVGWYIEAIEKKQSQSTFFAGLAPFFFVHYKSNIHLTNKFALGMHTLRYSYRSLLNTHYLWLVRKTLVNSICLRELRPRWTSLRREYRRWWWIMGIGRVLGLERGSSCLSSAAGGRYCRGKSGWGHAWWNCEGNSSQGL